jgi:two-component system OmpR family sensor kinase
VKTKTTKKASSTSLWGKTMRKLDAVPLSSRLVSILLILLTVGLSVAAFTTRQLIWTYMLDRTDSQLIRQSQLVINNIDQLSDRGSTPTDYFLQIRDANYDVVKTPLIPTSHGTGSVTIPNLPPSGSMGSIKINTPTTVASKTVASLDTTTGKTTGTATSSSGTSPWRVVALRWVADDDGSQGVFFIGLSLSDAMDTSGAVTRYFLVVGFLILALAMALGTIAISRTLAPLKRIEKTAAKIAAGDLSMRVPAAPENTEVGSLSSSLNIMLARIEQSFKEQENSTNKMKRFVSDASHELRTPLAAIHGYAELYRMQRNSPGALDRADEAIRRIETSSTRMASLVEDLLSLARLDEGRGADVTKNVRLDTVLADIGEDLHALDPHRPVTMGSLAIKPGVVGVQSGSRTRVALAQFEEKPLAPVTVIADSTRLRQVFTNIVGNIHCYTPDDSPVQISLNVVKAAMDPAHLAELGTNPQSLGEFINAIEVAGSTGVGTAYAFIRFADHGPGVKPEALGQLFERFYTADASRAREKGGTGLGMAIAKSVVKAHSGFICATQTPHGGLTINIGLPLPTRFGGSVEIKTKAMTAKDVVTDKMPLGLGGSIGSIGAGSDAAGAADAGKRDITATVPTGAVHDNSATRPESSQPRH